MTERKALKIVFGLSLLGAAFSGALSYVELFCNAPTSCPAIAPPGLPLLGYPACVYGFGMFVILAIISGLGLFSKRRDA
jgi:hypothetical protein